ncbi:DUF3592 domain-containing protein [uncultured Williamsia sp.]|uniref:DUF3592 domain-containing protein n=1 Tax=uncultured Williamsia sp. TaxID=259311 RepID=UPI0026092A27|nr:DUF3592 domain-containing protein [uncultured Williamsia sp.]
MPTALRRTQITLLIVGAIVTVMMCVVVAGCYRDDAAIDAHRGTAIADVVTAGATKSTVRFYTPDGELRSPRLGVFYPTDLTAGQRISVEYDTRNPDTVRVAGRDASLSIIPALSVVGWTWAVLLAAMVGIAEYARRRRRRGSDDVDDTGGQTAGEPRTDSSPSITGGVTSESDPGQVHSPH